MFYHASQIGKIDILKPSISKHKKSYVYFSEKRENVLVYLSNAIQKFCIETGFKHEGKYTPWGPYSFGKDGILELEEYYPNALYETYKGCSGYIYSVKKINNPEKINDIPFVFASSKEVKVDSVEYIEDAYEEIIKTSKEGKIRIVKFEELSENKLKWLKEIIKKEYEDVESGEDYKYFLENKFDFLKK